ncbi:MAG: 4'-phosphopantetheinyl transferase superfamily protein [Bacteroidetes bacterium]|nr:4'-phosphopantetheinyl transferase superfamily protein [Bacteroidota bacterium]MDA1382688.1 4'-phosphopantetheinyl transferase superfamily protein [Bacteroidota bacterium]
MSTMKHHKTIGLAVRQINLDEAVSEAIVGIVSKHYPKRDINLLSTGKIAELYAVIHCISDLLREDNWHLQHAQSGAPLLFENAKKSVLSISISHTIDKTEEGGIAYAAVILSREVAKIGVDIVLKADLRIKRIAHRVMRDEEIETGRLAEVWACKEAMYKALGPLLDFKRDLKVDFDIKNEDLVVGSGYNWKIYREDKIVVALGPF